MHFNIDLSLQVFPSTDSLGLSMKYFVPLHGLQSVDSGLPVQITGIYPATVKYPYYFIELFKGYFSSDTVRLYNSE